MWVERDVSSKISSLTKSRPAVLLTGARQTGKSSLLKKLFNEAQYVSFDNLRYVEEAKTSPEYFLDNLNLPVVLDEVQYVPELFRELKIRIDKEREKYGQWILTGSQLFELMRNVSESLAGRISILHLETLSANEIRKALPESIDEHLYKGGYPELWSNPLLDTSDFFESYIRTYIERDLKSLVDVKNLYDFRRLFNVLAARAGQLINFRDIARDVGVSDVTVKNWMNALQTSGIIYLLPPFYANIGKRMIKTPKLYFADHGLLSYLLDITSLSKWSEHASRGHIYENFVFMELIKTAGLVPGRNMFFYRDQNGVEIDFFVEKDSKLFLIEAKAGERIEEKKLNFNKVAPLFGKQQVNCVLAQNIKESRIMKMKDYYSYNPLYKLFSFDS